MTPVEQNELKGLKANETAFAKSIEAMEANPAHSPRVLADEKRGLAAPAPAIAEPPRAAPKPLFKKK